MRLPDNNIFKSHDLSVGKINLLYGSNGSGKTMLSRVFALMDINTNSFVNSIKEDLKKDLEIENSPFSKTLVFNADFIEYHFNFSNNPHAKITFNLKNQDSDITSITNKIEELKNEKTEKLKILKNFQDKYTTLENKKEEIIKNINKKIKEYCNNNTYPLLKRYYPDYGLKDRIKELMESIDIINEDTYKLAHQSLMNAKANKEQITDTIYIPLIQEDKYNEIKNILEEKIEIQNESDIDKYIQNLDNNKKYWIKSSIPYIKETPTECPLCKQPINLKEYITGYIDYFEKTKNTKVNTLSKLSEINLDNNHIIHNLEHNLIDSYKNSFMECKDNIFVQIEDYNEKIRDINNKIESKQNNPKEAIRISEYNELISIISSNINKLNDIIKYHNKDVAEGDTNNEQNIKTVIKYKIQENNYQQIKQDLVSINDWVNNDINHVNNLLSNEEVTNDNTIDYKNYSYTEIKNELEKIKLEIAENEAKKTIDASKFITEKLKELWGYEKIILKLNSEQSAYSITLKHNNGDTVTSPTLSEGEKTSIAFAYFLVKVDSLMNKNKDQNLLIFIDDPISSLDNYITYQVSEVLFKIKLKLKPKDKNNKGILSEYPNTKLFLSTHNWYLFYLLNRHKPLAEIDNRYTIFKNNDNKTVIDKLNHDKIASYFGEYPIIFKELYQFVMENHKSKLITDYDCYGISNKARKTIENFMFFKYGKDKPYWDDMNAVRIHDMLSPESHSVAAPELFPETIQNNVKKVLKYIETIDKSHYEAMIQ